MAKKKNFSKIRKEQTGSIDTLEIYASNADEKEEEVEKIQPKQEEKSIPKSDVKPQPPKQSYSEDREEAIVKDKPIAKAIDDEKVDKRKVEDPKKPFSTLVKKSIQHSINDVLDQYKQAIDYKYTKTDLVEEGLLKQIAALKRKLKEQEDSK
ncbi:MAG: hypothetical protein RIB01_15205 [Balneola sp.]